MVYINTSGASLSETSLLLYKIVTMPGHDHNLRKLYSIESLVTPNMVYNWICPVRTEEICPFEALSRVFSDYLRSIDKANTQESFLNFGFAAP